MSDYLDIELPSMEAIEAEERMRDLVGFVPMVSPKYMAPVHLTPLLRRFELAVDGKPQRVCCSAPPRHAKTESVLHVPAFALRRRPELTLSYSTYADRLSRSKSRKARRLAHEVGIETFGSVNEWRTSEGGGLLAGGVGGPLTGHGVDIAIVDDPCVAEGQLVLTRRGEVPIESVVIGDEVFTHMARWRRVVAVYDNGIKETIGVSTNVGRVIVTPEHLLYTSTGWKQAQHVSEVLCATYVSEVRQGVQGTSATGVLLPTMPDGLAATRAEDMRVVSGGVQAEGLSREVLFRGMRGSIEQGPKEEELCGMQQGVRNSQESPDVLLGRVSTEGVDGRLQEEERRTSRETVAHQGIQGALVSGTQGKNRSVCGVSVDGPPCGASHGLQPEERQTQQPNRALQLVSHAVSQVERLGPARVFDLTVEEDHSFVAGGVVVHNCKNRLEAESEVKRSGLVDWMRDVLMTRVEPGGSIFVFMTRWHPDDLVGTLVDEGFDYINLPAISDAGEPLWPERWPLDELRAREEEVGAYTWASLYQGQPRPRGAQVFNGVHTYEKAPVVYRVAGGIDSAYSMAKTADFSTYVEMKRSGEFYYVTDAVRVREPAPMFKARIRVVHERNPSMRWRWYVATSEMGAATLFSEGVNGVPVVGEIAKADKFIRALRYAAAWNAGKVLLPAKAPWLEDFVSEHAGFTGVNDRRDDLIDAAVAAFDELSMGGSTPSVGTPDRAPPLRSVGM